MELLGFEINAPEVATIVRWILRFVLVAFLAWLVKGRQEQDQEEEPEDEAEPYYKNQRAAQPRPGQRPQNQSRSNFDRRNEQNNYRDQRQQGGRDPYLPRDLGNNARQRRPVNSESVDFDAVINKMSKPVNMWEIRKDGVKPTIMSRDNATENADSSPKAITKQESAPKLQVNARTKEAEDANSGLKKNVLHGHTRPVTWIMWNRDGNLLFTCSKDKTVCVWSFPDGECLGTYTGHGGAVWACSVTGDSRWLVSGGADNNVIVWDASASRELARVELPGVCRFVEWANGGNSAAERFVTVHNKFASNPPAITVYRFDGEAIEQLLRWDSLPAPATQVRWGRDDLVVVSSHDSGELVFWNADTGAEVRRLKAHDLPVMKIDFSASDRHLVATASSDKKVKVWDLGEDGTDSKMLYELETDRPLNAVALGPITRDMVSGADGERPGCCAVIIGGGQDIRDVALSKGTSEEFDSMFFKVGATELEAIGSLKGHFGPVHTLAFKADGSAVASGSEDGCVRLHLFADHGASK